MKSRKGQLKTLSLHAPANVRRNKQNSKYCRIPDSYVADATVVKAFYLLASSECSYFKLVVVVVVVVKSNSINRYRCDYVTGTSYIAWRPHFDKSLEFHEEE